MRRWSRFIRRRALRAKGLSGIPDTEYNNFPLPSDYQEKTERVYARLMYPNVDGVDGRRCFGWNGYGPVWTEGGRGASRTTDYPPSDRHFSQALRGSHGSTRARPRNLSTSTMATSTIDHGCMRLA